MLKKLRYDEQENTWRAELAGELDVFQAPKLIEGMQRAFAEHAAGVALDCSGLTYIDSMGLGALVKLHKQAAGCGGGVTLTGLKPRIRKLFAITGLLETFGIGEEQADA